MKARTSSWLRRIIATVAIGGVMVPVLAVGAQAARFTDVPNGHQFLKEITWLSQSGITNGWSDGTFRPREAVSREAFAAFLYRDAGRPNVKLPSKSPFKDVPTNAQFYKEIVWLEQQNITNGWSDGTFRPRLAIERNAMAAFLYRYEGRPSFTPPSKSPFKDLNQNSKFYKEITWLDTQRITNGWSDGTFRPFNNVTREATAAFFYRMHGRPAVDVPSAVPKSFTMSGAGFGHGVGMSQYGAQGMAVDGYGAGSILQHYYKGTQVSMVDVPSDIKVEIFGSGSDDRDKVDLVVRSPGSDATHDGKWKLFFYDDSSARFHTDWEGINNEKLHVTRSGNSVTVTRDGGETATAKNRIELQWESTTYYALSSPEDPYVEVLKPNGSAATHGKYRHGRIFVSVPSTTSPRLIASNELKLNTEYLYGIAEIPSSWDIDALQAQAIVARGYAMRTMNYRTSCDCHIWDDIRHQNFTGWNKENEGSNAQWGKRWKDAVDRTNASSGARGKVLTLGGNIAQTYYFSSTGGRTESSANIWGGNHSHLVAVDDKWSLESRNPNRAWTRTITQAQAKSMFGLSDVVSIQVTARTSSNSKSAAKTVTATSSTGQKKSISGPDTIRSRVVGGHSPWIWSFTPNF